MQRECDMIARDRPLAARRWFQRVEKAVGLLAHFPLSGHAVQKFKTLPVREVVIGSYRIIYKVEPDRVRIINLSHSRQLASPPQDTPDFED